MIKSDKITLRRELKKGKSLPTRHGMWLNELKSNYKRSATRTTRTIISYVWLWEIYVLRVKVGAVIPLAVKWIERQEFVFYRLRNALISDGMSVIILRCQWIIAFNEHYWHKVQFMLVVLQMLCKKLGKLINS